MEIVIGLLALVLGVAGGVFVGRSQARPDAARIEEEVRRARDEERAAARRALESEGESARANALKNVEADAAGIRKAAEDDARSLRKAAEDEARSLRKEVEDDTRSLRKQAELDAEQLRLQAEREIEKELKQRRAELEKVEQRLSAREEKQDERAAALDRKQSEVAEEEKKVARLTQSVEDRTRSLREREATLDQRLEEIASLTREQARAEVLQAVEAQARLDGVRIARQIEEQASEEAEKRAKKILATTIQRYAGEYVAERTVSVVNLPSDDMKGRLIGREGRNIRALETVTGCDIIIDDTPEAVTVSCFDPVRREIARLSIERLLADGRIHPARIEEIVERTTTEVDRITKEAGEAAAFELGLTGLHPEVVRYMGRLKYRTSYGQNIYTHSIEVGFLCGLMAGELGLNVKVARRAGFLHDIGKAMEQSEEGGHAIVGAQFLKKYGEDDLIVNAVAAHHDEVKPASVIAHLVIAGDALSGARPGARREILESYVKRLEDLERISLSFDGVEKCYAIQAGREIRVLVSNDRVSDDQAHLLSRDIARKIESELTYPGQIRVTVIRETRASEIAR
jgi:ribonuclease Y